MIGEQHSQFVCCEVEMVLTTILHMRPFVTPYIDIDDGDSGADGKEGGDDVVWVGAAYLDGDGWDGVGGGSDASEYAVYVVTLCDIYYMMDWIQMVMVQMLLDFEIGMLLVTMLGGGNVTPLWHILW